MPAALPHFSSLRRSQHNYVRAMPALKFQQNLRQNQIVCSDLTTGGVGDSTALPGLSDHIDVPADLFLADGAYDGDPTCDLLLERFGEEIEIAILPPKTRC
jgi:hypothetical protein